MKHMVTKHSSMKGLKLYTESIIFTEFLLSHPGYQYK